MIANWKLVLVKEWPMGHVMIHVKLFYSTVPNIKSLWGSTHASDCTVSERGGAPLMPVTILCVREVVGLQSCQLLYCE